MQSLTVASFNIHWGRRPRSFKPYDLVDACRQLDADVLALQEVWRLDGEPSDAERVADALGYELHQLWCARAHRDPVASAPKHGQSAHRHAPRSHFVGRTGAPVGNSDWGQALLTRVPRGPVHEHRLRGFLFDDIDRVVMTTDIELDEGTITVCASHFPHLEHFSPLLRWRLRGVVPDPYQPAVLMGDFNMWRWVARFVVPGWRDTVLGATWPTPRPLFQIDHLMTTPSVVLTDGEVVRAGKSDHLPIRARVSLR